jgi:hypothetical protein
VENLRPTSSVLGAAIKKRIIPMSPLLFHHSAEAEGGLAVPMIDQQVIRLHLEIINTSNGKKPVNC